MKFEETFSINIVVSVTFNIFFTFVPTCSICNNIFSVLDVISMADLDYIIIWLILKVFRGKFLHLYNAGNERKLKVGKCMNSLQEGCNNIHQF